MRTGRDLAWRWIAPACGLLLTCSTVHSAKGTRLNAGPTIYRAAWIIPVSDPPIRDGALAIENGRITWLGPSVDLKPQASSLKPHSIDLGDVAILPGLINAHTHLELTAFAGRLKPQPLWTWFDQLIDLIRASDFAIVGPQSVRDGAVQSLAAGVTCVADISRTGQNVAVLAESPIRKVCFLELISGAASIPNDIPSLKNCLNELKPYRNAASLTFGLAPHTPYTVSRADLTATAAMAQSEPLPLTLHFLETPEEAARFENRAGAEPLGNFLTNRRLPITTPNAAALDLLEATGILAERPLLAHVNYIDDAGIRRLAEAGASVAYCPRAHAWFSHKPHRWRDMLAARINVCLGTDSLASNSSLSILEETRYLRRQSPDMPAQALLEMATMNAARALKLDSQIGSLTPGKLADFITIPISKSSAHPIEEILNSESQVTGVWLAGTRTV
ncbi:MAG TPA: amidohydrolase family protein [Phycisphaerae bacterium]|nr:amidohydrolase family protein [Phycisphaerae bacterium]